MWTVLATLPLDSGQRLLAATVSGLKTDLAGLKSALNPDSPEQILYVLRLGDRFEVFDRELQTLKQQVSRTEGRLEGQIQRSYESTTRHVESISGAFGWVALLLVPILLNAARDFLPRRRTPDSTDAQDD